MKEFEFSTFPDADTEIKWKFSDSGRLERFYKGHGWIGEGDLFAQHIGIRALLSAHTEREAIFAEAIEYARGCIHPANERSHAELDAIAARWQATT